MGGLVGAGRQDEARALAKAPDATLGDVLSIIDGSRKDLLDVAGLAELLAERIAGPEHAGEATKDAQPPQPPGYVDQLHVSAGQLHAPTSRIRRALNRIERRVSA